jgi:hypothetical protein
MTYNVTQFMWEIPQPTLWKRVAATRFFAGVTSFTSRSRFLLVA